MGIAFFTWHRLLAPLRRLLAGVGTRRTAPAPVHFVHTPRWRPPAPQRRLAGHGPVRVVRAPEPMPARGAGRMVICGRLADVCDELDRLAALEASAR